MIGSDNAVAIDITTAIGKLLCDACLRLEFSKSPSDVAKKLNLDDDHTAMFVKLDISQIEKQATVLLNKRWHEVSQLIPHTIDDLAPEATDLFMFYANKNWPEGHRRHFLDAFRFLQFLIRNQIHRPCGLELQRMRRMSKPA